MASVWRRVVVVGVVAIGIAVVLAPGDREEETTGVGEPADSFGDSILGVDESLRMLHVGLCVADRDRSLAFHIAVGHEAVVSAGVASLGAVFPPP